MSALIQQNYEGTVKPFQPFNPIDDAEKLYKAMKGVFKILFFKI